MLFSPISCPLCIVKIFFSDPCDMEESVNYRAFPAGHMSEQDLPIRIYWTANGSRTKWGQTRSNRQVVNCWLFIFSLGLWPEKTLKPRALPYPFTLSQLSSSHGFVILAWAPVSQMNPKWHKCNLIILATVTGHISRMFDSWGKWGTLLSWTVWCIYMTFEVAATILLPERNYQEDVVKTRRTEPNKIDWALSTSKM